MKKVICILLGLMLQFTSGTSPSSEQKFKKITLSNGINVLFHENFYSSTVMVGIIFHIGEENEPLNKSRINAIIATNIIDKNLNANFLSSGISYVIIPKTGYIEISATMHPEQIENFLLLIYEIINKKIKIQDLEIIKKNIILENKLEKIYKTNAVMDNVISIISPSIIFNEEFCLSITNNDIENFIKKNYDDCHISIIVCGAIGYKNLMKILQSSISKLSKRKEKPIYKTKKHISFGNRDIVIKNKHSENSLMYVYIVPQENIQYCDIFCRILDYEIFRFFRKATTLVHKYNIKKFLIGNDCFLLISLYPKRDIAIDYLDNMYKIFINKMIMSAPDEKTILSVIDKINIKDQIASANLEEIYHILQNICIGATDIDYANNAMKQTKEISPIKLQTFTKDIFHKNMLSKIRTQFNADI